MLPVFDASFDFCIWLLTVTHFGASTDSGYRNKLLLTPINSNNSIAETLTCALEITLAPHNTQF